MQRNRLTDEPLLRVRGKEKPSEGDRLHKGFDFSEFLAHRNTKLTPKLTDDFCRYVRTGMPFDAVCDLLGMSPDTFWTWKRKAEQFEVGNGEPKEYIAYAFFLAEVRKAFAEFRHRCIKKWKTSRDWVKYCTMLERRDRRNFSKNDPMGGTDEDYDPDERFL